jgi:hypothetical protein
MFAVKLPAKGIYGNCVPVLGPLSIHFIFFERLGICVGALPESGHALVFSANIIV